MRIAYSADNESIDEQQDDNAFDYADTNEFQPFVNNNQQVSEKESEEEDSDYTNDEEDKCDDDNRNYKGILQAITNLFPYAEHRIFFNLSSSSSLAFKNLLKLLDSS
ncbi:hypothetical protein QVD17_39709 [Tagetes erecta]|uniref:Uncharacterized protein n=1 Tax=Tagetes erecta TaxID=13708 RepID=A0AAD8NGI4_TARER|nr:hypothetical protein QVD17_39709 [Tagetes erecta]